ncbi:MAG: thioesterase family protein [Stagnimonas sp.]|nr:thioesterase family protein [Stagnimonas sp.]
MTGQSRPQPHRAQDYPYFVPVTTRWMDNDVYGHVNNVTYYSYFDTAANHYLIREGGLDIHGGAVIGLVVESNCRYFAPLEYPMTLQVGLRVDQLGNRAVTYGIAIFREGEDSAAAQGQFVHVFVDRASRRPAAMPDSLRAALERIRVGL